MYTGTWAADRPCGQGTKVFENGDVYTGAWEDARPHGHGRFRYVEGGYEYVGGFAAGRYAGLGTMSQDGKLVAAGDWSSWRWIEGQWDGAYPREGGRGTRVTARRSQATPQWALPSTCFLRGRRTIRRRIFGRRTRALNVRPKPLPA